MRGLALLGMAVAIEGCYAPPSASVACGAKCTDSCPDDLICSDGFCASADGTSCPQPTIEYAKIVVGARHTCALSTDGNVYCWGDNAKGALGLGIAVAQEAVPTEVAPADGQWTDVSAGAQHTCGIHAGVATCWGSNKYGESVAGRGGVIETPTPVMFSAGTTPPAFEHIASGGAHSCALGAGQLWCWGVDDEVGAGVPIQLATQILTPDSSDSWTAVSTGYGHSCALTQAGTIQCWGDDGSGQCGQPATSSIPTPTNVPLPGMTPISIFAGNVISCVIASASPGATSGKLLCWGANNSRIDGSNNGEYDTPTPVGSFVDWTSVTSLSTDAACGTRSGGKVYCWGFDPSYSGALADGLWNDSVDPMTPNPVGTGDAVVGSSIADGRADAFGCLHSGTTASCWGSNAAGELGNGVASESSIAVEVTAPRGTWQHVSAGVEHACATTDDNALWCWGGDGDGQISAGIARGDNQPCVDGSPCDYDRPTAAPPPLASADQIVAGADYNCVLANGTVSCWGDGVFTALPDSNDGPVINTLSGTWMRISGGMFGTCAFPDASSAPSCWGMPLGASVQQPTAFDDPNGAMTGIGSMSFGAAFACGWRQSTSSRVCWGSDVSSQLGTMPAGDIADPTELEVGVYSAITAGQYHTCGINLSTQEVDCWGRDDNGQSGQLAGADVALPTAVENLPPACTVVGGSTYHSCAICGGAPWCWGNNTGNQLGGGPALDPFSNPILTATQVVVPAGLTFTELAVGDFGGCAIASGRLFCWGDSQHGALGVGGKARNIPTPIGTTD